MFCMKCGASLPDDASFCFKCGCNLRNLDKRSGTNFSDVEVGDYVKFGRYPKKYYDTAWRPIEWEVLEVIGDEALLISRYGIDSKQYDRGVYCGIKWENCDLCRWLNSEFLDEAFTEEEQERMVDNMRSCSWDEPSPVFCLSLEEAEQYFSSSYERRCKPTMYAKIQGARDAEPDTYYDDENVSYCWWWLRSPGCNENCASYVRPDGELYLDGKVDDIHFAVRPAVWVNLES